MCVAENHPSLTYRVTVQRGHAGEVRRLRSRSTQRGEENLEKTPAEEKSEESSSGWPRGDVRLRGRRDTPTLKGLTSIFVYAVSGPQSKQDVAYLVTKNLRARAVARTCAAVELTLLPLLLLLLTPRIFFCRRDF